MRLQMENRFWPRPLLQTIIQDNRVKVVDWQQMRIYIDFAEKAIRGFI